ncbi:hypothetical protein J2Z40_003996, partial [Cytobacillus eiseniae]|nr:hypothetical protein [Cytobacillus eiseniae]
SFKKIEDEGPYSVVPSSQKVFSYKIINLNGVDHIAAISASSSSTYPRRTGHTSVDNATGRRVFVDLEVTSQSSKDR